MEFIKAHETKGKADTTSECVHDKEEETLPVRMRTRSLP